MMSHFLPYNFHRTMMKSLGKKVILYGENNNNLELEIDNLFKQIRQQSKLQTVFTHPRFVYRQNKCKWNKRYKQDITRHYHQQSANFFVHNVLARKEINIPLR